MPFILSTYNFDPIVGTSKKFRLSFSRQLTISYRSDWFWSEQCLPFWDTSCYHGNVSSKFSMSFCAHHRRLAKKNGNQQQMNRFCIKRSNFAARTNALKWHFEVILPPILSRSARRGSRFRASEDAKALYLAPLKATRVTWPQAITVIWFHGVPGIMSREGAWLEGNIWWTWRSHELSLICVMGLGMKLPIQ